MLREIDHKERKRSTGKAESKDSSLLMAPVRLFRELWANHRNEFSQSCVRLTFVVGVGIYIISAAMRYGFDSKQVFFPALVATVGGLLALSSIAHLAWSRRDSSIRRGFNTSLDIVSLSLFMYFGNEVTAPFFPIYLWVTLANGVRFGERALLSTAILSSVCFSVVALFTPFWAGHIALAAGLIIALITMPIYVYRLLQRVDQARREAENASEAKGRFLANVSHEIRTPLNAIIGLTEILKASRLGKEEQQMIRSIGISARALTDLMGDVLDFSKIEAGKVASDRVEFSIYDLLAELEAIIAPQAQLKGLDFIIRTDGAQAPYVIADKKHLREILVNLAANAIRYTEEGEVCITLHIGDAVQKGESLSRQLTFKIADTGIGIPEHEQELVFESFSQSQNARSTSRGGVGLGLAICKQLIDLLGGDLSIESSTPAGSVFVVEVPVDIWPVSERTIQKGPPQVIQIGDIPYLADSIHKLTGGHTDVTIMASFDEALRAAMLNIDGFADRPVVIVSDSVTASSGFGSHLAEFRASLSGLPIVLLASRNHTAEGIFAKPRGMHLDMVFDPEREEQVANALAFCGSRTAEQQDEEDSKPDSVDMFSEVSLSILMAEDNKVNGMVASKIIETLGHKIDIVENGEEALEAMDARSYDLVFLDVNMPVMDGLETVRMRRLEEMGIGHRTPIVAITADATTETINRCHEAGMDMVIHKPVSLPSLRRTIEKMLKEQPEILRAHKKVAEVVTLPKKGTRKPSHADSQSLLDHEKIEELRSLSVGGAFLKEVVDEFLQDSEVLVNDLAKAVERRDVNAFRDVNHALRSCAANVGAAEVFRLCEAMSGATTQALDDHGDQFMTELREVFELSREALQSVAAGVRRGATA